MKNIILHRVTCIQYILIPTSLFSSCWSPVLLCYISYLCGSSLSDTLVLLVQEKDDDDEEALLWHDGRYGKHKRRRDESS